MSHGMTENASEKPAEAAAGWLATLTDPSCADADRQAFARWLKRSNVNVEEFLVVSTLIRRLETGVQWPQQDIAQLIAQARADSGKVASLVPPFAAPTARRNVAWRWFAPAAAIVVIIGATLVLGLSTVPPLSNWLGGETYATGLGELRSVTLSDGTIVQIDAQSAVRERFTARERLVELERGTAIFRVARAAHRPFKVTTRFAEIVVLGTTFNVSARQERSIVTVIEGRVRITGPRQSSIELSPGQQVAASAHTPLLRAVDVDPLKITAWTSRRLYFEDTPLAEAVQEFARYSPQSVMIEDEALAQRRISGTFDTADVEALIAFLGRYTDAEIERRADVWHVRSKK